MQGEYFWFDVERRLFSYSSSTVTGPTLHFNGGYIEAGWTITGETRTYNNAAGAYNGMYRRIRGPGRAATGAPLKSRPATA